jgi:hypothetical protein
MWRQALLALIGNNFPPVRGTDGFSRSILYRRRYNDAIQLDIGSIPLYSNWLTAIELCDLFHRGAGPYKVLYSLSNSEIKP